MTPKEFIENRLEQLKSIKKPISNFKSNKELADFIYATIMSKKFRKFSVNTETKDHIRKAIELNLENNKPIRIALPYGAYKLWRFEESPEVDWAELFSMIYYARWLKPITDVYLPGVWFDFCGDDAILELMNNIPEEETGKYKKSFRNLIKFITPYLPHNFKYTFNPVGERYSSKEEFLADLDTQIEELKQKGEISLTERRIAMAEFNIKPKPGEKLDFEKNRLIHDAYMNVSKRRPYHKADDIITVCCTPFGGNSLPLGTTKTSVVKFQTGVGVLRKMDNNFIEYIFSPSQLEKAKFNWELISLEGLSGKNFTKIRIQV